MPLEGEAGGPPLAFLGTICKDGGAVDAAASLLGDALACCPASPSYALNLVHAHECNGDYQRAFEVGRRRDEREEESWGIRVSPPPFEASSCRTMREQIWRF